MGTSSRRLSKLLTNGTSTDMTVNGSSTAVSFTLDPPPGVTYYVHQLILTIHSTGMDLATVAEIANFGAVGAALSNGIRVFESRGTPPVLVELFPTPVKRITDFYRYLDLMGQNDVRAHTDGIASGTDSFSVAIGWAPGRELVLRDSHADLLTVYVQDNLTSLTLFEAHAIGRQTQES
tara:strand:- start:1249 stop:1782 length:534 start_codon:yes stop_codon:yes gene_type:complete